MNPPALRGRIPSIALVIVLASFGSPLCGQNPTTPVSPAVAVTYTIALTDRLRVSVYQEDDLSVISRVDAKGTVNLPLVGEIPVAGLTISAAQNAIEKAYREGRYLRSPQVTINVEEYAPREISVQGQVRNPGRLSLPIESGMTVLEAITKSGGFTDTAKGTAVTITRVTADGKKRVFSIDVDSLIKGKDRANIEDNTLVLQPGDIVYVPERLI
ncbi:MAG TPA: polysaccharide biosynthesis/export family protein [Opitutaceae bacterium]